MSRPIRGLFLAALLLLPCARLIAHIRLIHPSSGTPLRWSSPSRVGVVIQANSSDDILDGSGTTALRLAIQEWNAVTGTTATLVEDVSPASRNRADYRARDIHLLLFDETNASGFFPAGSSTVAVTPVWFSGDGTIQDADVLFNGRGFSFTTRGSAGRFDVQDVATHELGHLLGLDHSGASGATMYPYVDQDVILQRSLAEDELAALRDAYPAGAHGQITGTVRRVQDDSPVAGAYLVARDAEGRTRASILADRHGSFCLRGLEAGTYSVYARPLDSPVNEGNLSPGYAGAIDTDFEPALYAAQATITGSNRVELGTLAVAGDVSLTLGSPVDRFPLRAVVGESRTIYLHGSGLFVGSTLEASDPDLFLGAPRWQGNLVSFELGVPAGELPGHVDLTVTNAAGRLAILPSAIELTPPSPTVVSVVPGIGSTAGGDTLLLFGTNFEPGLRVVIGERIYTDGVEARVLDPRTIRLTTAAMRPGVHDVVVIDACGVEGRSSGGFRASSAPGLVEVLPRAGDSAGGTRVLLTGEDFLEGMQVRIGGVDQGPVELEGPNRAYFSTRGGVAGGPYLLEIENPDGAGASQAFAYLDQADPRVTSLTPAAGPAAGGTRLTLDGAGFTPTLSVSFLGAPGASPIRATEVSFLDAHTLQVVTPEHSRGPASLWLTDTNGSGVLVAEAFTFTGGRGGGGCHGTLTRGGPGDPWAWLAGAWWWLAALALAFRQARRARVALVASPMG